MRLGLLLGIALNFLVPAITDSQAEIVALVRKFESTYRSSRTLSSKFLETYFENGRVVRAESGTAYFGRPGKMRWEYLSPEPNLYVIDGKFAWFYVPADHTVTRIPAKQSSDARTPLVLLAGEMKISRICKSVEAATSEKSSDPRGVVVRCNLRGEGDNAGGIRSHERSKATSYALFELNSATGELLRVLIGDPGGIQVEFQFKDWQFDPRLTTETFHFEPPRGVAIVDGLPEIPKPNPAAGH